MANERVSTTADWQTAKSTVLERNSFMFLNEVMSDVRFRVEEEVFPAHKYVLATSSPVFFAMFYGPLAERTEEIKVHESDAEGFKELLRCLYTDQAELTMSTVVSVINLAEKYMIPSLKRLCAEYLEENISLATVLKTLSVALHYNEEDLAEECLCFIRKHTEDVLEREEFTEISADILKLVLKEEKFSASEVKVFRAASRWAEARCIEAGEKVSGPNKRRKLGDCVQLIRFPTMTSDELISEVFSTDILTSSEIVDVSCTRTTPLSRRSEMFDECPRNSTTLSEGPIMRCFRTIESQGWEQLHRGMNCELHLSVDTAVYVIGFGMFGWLCCPTTVSHLFIKPEGSSNNLAEVTNREFSSYMWKGSCGPACFGFDVLFDKPVKIQPGEKYVVGVHLSGVIPGFTVKTNETVTVRKVQFNLETECADRTAFSEIIFRN